MKARLVAFLRASAASGLPPKAGGAATAESLHDAEDISPDAGMNSDI
jgi:hypothetical protein